MKVLYSQIKELVPGLKAEARDLAEVLTMVGMMVDGFVQVKRAGKQDFLLSLETRNRVDCWSVWGLAKEVAAYYGLETQIPYAKKRVVEQELNIRINAREAVRRVKAASIRNLSNQSSPEWLKEVLALYELKSLNLLVDLSNYAMIMTGYASHLLDADKLQGSLNWQLNKQERAVTTLDGSEVSLKGGELVIVDEQEVVALAGLVGTRVAAIDERTKNIIVEMAIYDGALIKKNSRDLVIVTEAGNRLAREMDTESLEAAFNYLVELIMTEAGGQLMAKCDYYPVPKMSVMIKFDPTSPSRFAGIEIVPAEAMEILKALRCQVVIDGEEWLVTPPTDRGDLTMAEDLVEEVIRMKRYDSIPFDQVPALAVTTELTKPIYYLKDRAKDVLVARGFDEVLSQPLVAEEANNQAAYLDYKPIVTQNSVNDDYPVLRLSLAVSLLRQWDEFAKKNLETIKIFEIGKVFGIVKGDYVEVEHLAILQCRKSADGVNGLAALQVELEALLGQLGLTDLTYEKLERAPSVANGFSAYEIKVAKSLLGVIYKTKPREELVASLAEIDLEVLVKLLQANESKSVVELEQKLVLLDANIEIKDMASVKKRLTEIKKQVGEDLVWNIAVVDSYQLPDQSWRLTIRLAYQKLSDTEAKEMHKKLFG
jgi:phenylalanyl-tRNA synthetase beta chain